MRILSLTLLALFVSVGCGDASNFEPPTSSAPETRDVVLGSISDRFQGYDQTFEVRFRINDQDFERSDVHEVRIECSQGCIMLAGIEVFDDGVRSAWSDGYQMIVDGVPMHAMRGDDQVVQFTLKDSADVDLSIVAKILK